MEPKRIVRFMATDLPGTLAVERALRRIRGVGKNFSRAVCIATTIDPRQKIGLLSDGELADIEKLIRNPPFPRWMLNRRKDPESGEDRHLVGSALDFQKMEDINTMKRIRSYKGVRHSLGQPVRGQRTRSSFRTQKSVGVTKKSARQAAKPAPAKEAKK